MSRLKIVETTPGKYSLLLNAGTTGVDAVVESLGHEPNGYFWDGVARRLTADAVDLKGRFGLDPEAGMFCAYGEDREALAALADLMDPFTTDADRIRELVAAADAEGFDFDE